MLTGARIYVLPTGRGLAFLSLAGVVLTAAINYDNSLAYALAFLLGAVFLLAPFHTWRNLAGLALRAGRAEEVFAGGTARFPLHLRKPGGREAVALRVLKRPYAKGGPRGGGPGSPTSVDLEAGAGATVWVERPAPRRGWLPLGEVVVESRYPLGLFRAWSPVRCQAACLVLPRPAGEAPLPGAQGGGVGERASGLGGQDFSGLRPYLPGDPPRRMAWKALARTGAPEVKRFEEGGAAQLRLELAQARGDTEARLSQLCRWVLEAERLGLAFSLRLPEQELASGEGPGHRRRCLQALALHGLTP